ncbi:MAG: DUF2271 domain-containing protein [Treponema sp.]|nr:DUF2271 domain-containing protein [Treponema sp.]
MKSKGFRTFGLPCLAVFLLLRGIVPAGADPSADLELSVSPGAGWKIRSWIGIFPMTHRPQFAAWIEDEEGNYIATFLVSSRGAQKNWRSAPREGRPEALPVWEHALGRGGQNSRAEIDGVSAATPVGSVSAVYRGSALKAGKEYRVFFEVNHSFDYNETWPKKDRNGKSTGVNGQPSLVYQARFTAGQPGQVRLEPAGCGAADGSHGNISPGTGGITSALSIVEQVSLRFN